MSLSPKILPRFLPDDWKGGFVLLVMIFVISAFLDNIAAAMIGGAIAFVVVFNKRVHIGYLAAIIAASNAGGSGSVAAATTTTLMWDRWSQPATRPPRLCGCGHCFANLRSYRRSPAGQVPAWITQDATGVIVEWSRSRGRGRRYSDPGDRDQLFARLPGTRRLDGDTAGRLVCENPLVRAQERFRTIFLVALVTCASLMPARMNCPPLPGSPPLHSALSRRCSTTYR